MAVMWQQKGSDSGADVVRLLRWGWWWCSSDNGSDMSLKCVEINFHNNSDNTAIWDQYGWDIGSDNNKSTVNEIWKKHDGDEADAIPLIFYWCRGFIADEVTVIIIVNYNRYVLKIACDSSSDADGKIAEK